MTFHALQVQITLWEDWARKKKEPVRGDDGDGDDDGDDESEQQKEKGKNDDKEVLAEKGIQHYSGSRRLVVRSRWSQKLSEAISSSKMVRLRDGQRNISAEVQVLKGKIAKRNRR